ncbi:unnamed protein product [Paramecium octaurelia]|uniref:Transmembrane protein n=1 Tax=Paramecium octaurelia TaxID=43137 RepID=A0A8S1X9Z9_PAROT|nr:unnamed protein product [Paramecium octaurelia]
MVFYNCETDINLEICHLSCFECIGPTKYDCLSCDPSTKRIYNQKQNTCICPYGKIELDGECKDYSAFQLTISKENNDGFKCSYGYFECEDKCCKCPSKIRNRLITCIECITNPKTWINNPYCQYNYVTDSDDRPFTKQDDGIGKYFFDGVDLKHRENQELDQGIYQDYLQTFDHLSKFCSYCLIDLDKEKCFFFTNCVQCQIEISRPKCTKCVMNFKLSDGVCSILNLIQTSNVIICQTPYYQTYYYTCILCPIQNCLYCFDFIKDDIQKNTILYKFLNVRIDANDQEVQVGCAQCYEGFLYDFTLGKCILRQPQIQNCLSSFVNQQGKELCILSSVQDFTVAPQIINCQNIIQNCKQCFRNIQTILRCLICEEGYYTDLTGFCYTIQYNYNLIPQNTNGVTFIRFPDANIWRHLVQSFSLQFSQKNFPYALTQLFQYNIECKDGYSLFKGKCIKYCDQNCQICEQDKISEIYTCSLCLLDNYNQPYRVQENGMCLICPSLCQVCQIRSDDSIMNLNPNYIINKTNTQYTTQCLKSISNLNVQINPYLQIAQYIYDQNNTAFEYNVNYACEQEINFFDPQTSNYYENEFNFSYFNEFGLKQFILSFQFQPCLYYQNKSKSVFKAKIFSIQLLKLILTGSVQMGSLYTIENFNSVEFKNLIINLENNLSFQFNNYGKAIDYSFQNCSFFGNQQKFIIFTIPMIIDQNFFLHNVSIFNVNINNSMIYQINSATYHENIFIDFIFLLDCIMNNTILFYFNINSKKIVIENLLIERCEFHNFTLLNIQQQIYPSKIIMRSIKIKNSTFSNSTLIDGYENNMLFIYTFQMIENQIINSQLIRFSKDLFIFNFTLIQNVFKKCILFEKQYSNNYQYEIKIKDIEISTNSYQNFQVIVIDQNKISPTQPNQQTQFFRIIIIFKLKLKIIYLNSLAPIYQFRIFFYLFNISQIQFKNVLMNNEILEYRIPLHYDCASSTNQYSKLLFVKGFQNQSLIEIQSNDPFLNEDSETITIQNVTFIKNILMKISSGNIFSLISIYSNKVQQIHFENIQYQQNSYYQYIIDPSYTSASLLFINSVNSSVLLNNIQCFENSLTNSSNSFITISTREAKVEQIKVLNHNYLRKEFWNRYYEIELQDNLNQIDVNFMIEQILSIKNKGGVMQLIVDKLILKNGLFQYIIAKSSSVMDIITKGNGIVILSDCSIAYTQTNLLSNQEQQGAISINSQNSYLTLTLQNFNFTNVYNKLASAIISIEPFDTLNNIIIRNVLVSDSFSLINLFLALQFPYQYADQNKVTIENIFLQQSQEASLQFTRQLNLFEPVIAQKITQDNAIFNIQGCQLKIIDLTFQGFVLSGIINLVNCKMISLVNILFDQITLFYDLNLLHIEQVAQSKSNIQISNLNIQKITYFNITNQNLVPYIYPNFFIEYSQCQTSKAVYLPSSESQQSQKLNNFEQIQSVSSNSGSILSIECQNNQTKIFLKSVVLQNNYCKTCKNGLIYFSLTNFLYIKIQDVSCIGNKIEQFGCINSFSDRNLQGKFTIINSVFINNTGSQGIALSSSNVKAYLLNIKIFNNTATLLGGGLYLDLNNQEFLVKSSYIQQNKAREGGGMYLNGDQVLNEINFVESLLNFNKAELTTDNLQEQPSHLDLSINNQIMHSDQIHNQISQKILKLHPYRIIQQGQIIKEDALMLPSNQEIAKYELYNPKQKKFTSYINELSIQFKNRFNEQLLNFTGSSCQIIEQILDIKQQTTLESNNISLIQFNQTKNNFDLGMLILTLDPYNRTGKEYQIQIYCKAKNQIEEMSYIIKVKSLVCQLGEFYVLNGCVTCQSKQGFYSVTYNATKCSIFDKIKFEAITSNNINLKPGYWRPHFESDLVNECFKNINSCKGGWVVGDEICKTGYIGGLCEECDKYNQRGDGFYFKNDNLTCWNCSDFSINMLSLFLITAWVFLSTLITLTSVENTNQLFTLFKLTQKFSYILFKLNLNKESIMLKLFLNYIWIYSVIFTFNIQFSFSFLFVNQVSDTSYFLTRNLDCKLSQSFEIELIYMRVLVIFILIAIQIFIIQLAVSIFSIVAKVKLRNHLMSITFIYLYIQNQAAIITQLFSILANREISSISYVQGDVSLLFESSNHQAWMYKFAIPVSLLIGLILPLFLLLFLYQKRDQFDKISLRRHIGYLFNEYNINRSFWEWVKLWKKTIIIVILIYFETNIFLKGFFIGMCLMIYQMITSSYLPYIYPKLNKLDLSSGQLCSMAIFLAAVQYFCEQQNEYVQARILQILILFIFFKFCFPYLNDIAFAYYEKYKEKILTFIILVLKTVKPNSGLIWKLSDKLDSWRQKKHRIERNFKKLRQLIIVKKRQDNKELQQICVPTLSHNKSGELKFKLLNL